MQKPAAKKAGKIRFATTAIIEEVTFLTQPGSFGLFRKNSTSARVKSVASNRNSSALALILSPEKHRRQLNRPSGENAGHVIEMFLSKWVAHVLRAESIRVETGSLFAMVDSELALFCHLWLEWEMPFWTSSTLMEIRQQFAGVVTIELLAVVSSLLIRQGDTPKVARRWLSFDALLQDARNRLGELLALGSNLIPGPSLLDVIRERHIWMLRRRSLSPADITPTMQRSLREFVESSLNIQLPDIPIDPSQPKEGNGGAQTFFYSNPTLAQSLHASESSSFRFFVNCARSMRSFWSLPFSSHSSFKRQLAMAYGLNRSLLSAGDALSESFQSMSIKESVDGEGFLRAVRPLDTVVEAEGNVRANIEPHRPVHQKWLSSSGS